MTPAQIPLARLQERPHIGDGRNEWSIGAEYFRVLCGASAKCRGVVGYVHDWGPQIGRQFRLPDPSWVSDPDGLCRRSVRAVAREVRRAERGMPAPEPLLRRGRVPGMTGSAKNPQAAAWPRLPVRVKCDRCDRMSLIDPDRLGLDPFNKVRR